MTTLGSLFTGIGGFDLGFERAGFITSWQVEIEDFPLRVLESRFPRAKRFKDIRNCGAHNLEPVDCITAGWPCQDLSVAGKRAGLGGERSGLFYEFVRILRELRPSYFVGENVPGIFSSWTDTADGTKGVGEGEWRKLSQTNDFDQVCSELSGLGYCVAWRILDSRFFGVAQRRRRVFFVGSLGNVSASKILFEPEGGTRDSATGREERPEVAYTLAASARKTGDGHGNAWNTTYVANPITQTCYKRHDEDTDTIIAATLRASDGHNGHSSPRGGGCDNLVTALCHLGRGGADDNEARGGHLISVAGAPPDADGMRESSRLPQGMDSARYRALGNAVTVSVAEWIARRIMGHMKKNIK